MIKKFAFFVLICLFILFSIGLAIGEEEIKGGNNVSKAAIENEMINAQLDHIDEAIGKLIKSISNKPIKKRENKLSNDEVAAIIHIPEEDIKSEIIKQRLVAIEKSITNIEKALVKIKTEVGSNCSWESVCTLVVCTKWGPPPDVSGGTTVCLESECRTWEYKFVCK